LTSYRVGGPAEFFAEPPDAEALGRLLRKAKAAGQQVHVLGRGTNLLVADAGVKGLVVRLPEDGFGALERDGLLVRAGSALGLAKLVNWSAAQGLCGLECLLGIPGSVGAALRMNAGGNHGQIGSRVRRVFGVEYDGTPFEADREGCGFIYRGSNLGGCIVTRCELDLSSGNRIASRERLAGIIGAKAASQPLGARSAGCVFKNPSESKPAGRLLDELGLKGLRVGGAAVSTLHANFLVCEGQACAQDLAQLIRLLRQRVYEAHGIMLELEIEVWGFATGELLAGTFHHRDTETQRTAGEVIDPRLSSSVHSVPLCLCGK
jgi:UDP-N-acetylmuramate dehydrogenase